MIKILTIVGARPQFIKAGTLSRAISKYNSDNSDRVVEIIVHTGQHYDSNMSDIFFHEMQLPKPNYFLGIGGKSHGAMTGQMIEKIEEVAIKEKPDWIVVYGDTNSTLAGALVASKLYIKLAHIEAGLRSFNMNMPEEINRILTDRVSAILFCPTDTAVENLKNEGFPFKLSTNHQQLIINVGDIMYEGTQFYKNLATKPNIDVKNNFILCTIHRAENTDDEARLKNIFEALDEIAQDTQIVLPLHPRTKKLLANQKLETKSLTIIDPIGYLEMIWLINNSNLVITDSGGLQKEAYFFQKFCITLRDETEWVELVKCKVNTLVGSDKEKIIKSYKNHKPLNTNHQSLNLYGDGNTSKMIIDTLVSYD